MDKLMDTAQRRKEYLTLTFPWFHSSVPAQTDYTASLVTPLPLVFVPCLNTNT